MDQNLRKLREAADAKRAEATSKWAAFAKQRDDARTELGDKYVEEMAKGTESEYVKKLDETHEDFARTSQAAENLLVAWEKEAGRQQGPADDPESKRHQPRPDEMQVEAKRRGETPGETFTKSAEYEGLVKSGVLRHGSASIQTAPVEVIETKALITGLSSTSAGAFVESDRLPGVVGLLQRPLFLRELVTVIQTDSDTIEYVEMTGFTNNAAEVAEATATAGASGTKPESAMAFAVRTKPVSTIAHWIPVTRQALQDAPAIRGYIDTYLRRGVEERLDVQMLRGDGTAPNLSGILDHAIQEQDVPDAGNIQDSILRAVTKIRLAYMEPNGVVMNPSDWETLQLTRDGVNGGYIFGGPVGVGAGTVWGMRPVINTGVAADEIIVGDFSEAILAVRSGLVVLTTDSHSDFFIRNMVVLLAEMRAGFYVRRPNAFVRVSSDIAS